MARQTVRTCVVFVVLMLFVGSGWAGATTIFYAEVFGEALANDGFTQLVDSFASGPVLGSDTTSLLTASAAQGGTATAGAQVLNGSLKAYSTGAGPGTNDTGRGTASASYWDTLTLTSTSLAPGTLVNLAFTLDLSYSFFSSDPCQFAEANVGASVGSSLGVLVYTADTCSGVGSNTTSGTFQAQIGQELPVFATLDMLAIGKNGQSASVNAFNTLNFFIDPQGAFTYTTASGNTYFTPAEVPEPMSVVLLGTGLVGIAACRFRHRKIS